MNTTNGYLMTALELREQIDRLTKRYNLMLMYGNNAEQAKEEQLPFCDVKWEYPE